MATLVAQKIFRKYNSSLGGQHCVLPSLALAATLSFDRTFSITCSL